jgi:hypothetical protein
MCDYENPIITYWMSELRKNLNKVIDNLIEIKKVNGLTDKSEQIKKELRNLSKFIEVLKRQRNFK